MEKKRRLNRSLNDFSDNKILRHIISFLPTNEAVRTCVLSKRWETLWMSTTKLQFVQTQLHHRTINFLNFVEWVLINREAVEIQEFFFECNSSVESDRVNRYIALAVKRKVQKLHFRLDEGGYYQGRYIGNCYGYYQKNHQCFLPLSLFACKSLVDLRLDLDDKTTLPSSICFPNVKNLSLSRVMFPTTKPDTDLQTSFCFPNVEILTISRVPFPLMKLDTDYNPDMHLPSSIWFPKVKILTISHVQFPDDKSTRKLFPICPLLEELFMDNCVWGHFKFVTISAPKLWNLSIEQGTHKLWVKDNVFAKNLKCFRYSGHYMPEFSFHGSPSLDEVVWVWDGKGKMDKDREVADGFICLLQGLSIKTLKILSFVIESLTREHLAILPTLNNLIHLEVEGSFLDLSNEALQKILQNSPSLETLILQGITSTQESDEIFDTLPSRLSSLKKIEIKHFREDESDLRALKMLTEQAVALDKLELHLPKGNSWNLDKRMKIRQMFAEFHGKLILHGLPTEPKDLISPFSNCSISSQ